MPRFTGRNTSNTTHMVRAQTPGNAKQYSLAPNTAFDFYVNDVESPDIRTQLAACAGVNFQEAAGTATPKMVQISAPAAAGANAIHAAIAATVAAGDITTGFTNPDVPRNLELVFAMNWDGGDILVTGTDQYDASITENFVGASATTRTGTKIFKTVTKLTKSAVGVQAVNVTIGTKNKLGIAANFAAAGVLFVDGAVDAGTWDTAVDGVLPTTLPNGARNYLALVNV